MLPAAQDKNGARRSNGTSAKRVLPHNLDAEASVLGGVILDNTTIELLSELETDHFFDFRHKVIWQAIRTLQSNEKPFDVVTIENEIERVGKLDAIGGMAYLGELSVRVPTVANVQAYAQQVLLLHRNRSAIISLSSALERAQNWPHDPVEMVSEVASDLARFEADHPSTKREERARWSIELNAYLGDEEPDDDDAVDWIIRDLIPRGEPAIWGGPMKGGKTWSAMDLCLAMALGENWLQFENTLRQPAKVMALFLEDNLRRITKRLAELSRARGREFLSDPIIGHHLRVSRTPLRLPDAKDQRSFAAEVKAWGAKVVVIDNLTRVMMGDPNSTRDAAAFTRAWTELGDETGATIVFLHHTKKPSGDMRESDPFDSLKGSSDFGAAARNMIVVNPLRLEKEMLAEVRMRGNLDLRRDSFALGFERWPDEKWGGKYCAKLVDKGEVSDVKTEAKKQRKDKKESDKKAELSAKYRERRELVLSMAHKNKTVSQVGAALELGISANTLKPVFESLVSERILKRSGKAFEIVIDEPPASRQGDLL